MQTQEKSSAAADLAIGEILPRRTPRHGALFHSTILPLGLLLLVLAAGEYIPFDLWVQDHLYAWDSHNWLIVFDKHSALGLTFYVIPKILLGFFAASLLLLTIRQKWGRFTCPWSRLRLVYVLLCLALIPSVVAVLKAHTGVAYPRKIDRYGGGNIPYRTLWQSIPHHAGEKRYKGWPAGHASGGYALFGLTFAALSQSGRKRGLMIALTAGSLMGTYQMLAGNHYLSHTIVTLLLAWLVAGMLASACRLEDNR
ncbi:phosphatase PAP2 family protein [Oligosphaera ethanolica]|uniref:Membrane-associated PAP2 superfamily phosphatase n=1 Tax=Oligosphaera ethanolica TaxID=760260 RepID=A0AAE4APE9_9BACT|nr:phosphatase PAP2 family protein [Oligosphaera ethanolica]MDQ0290455.1 membrane-associated PAP2 superfamily phosphatase [Oligosphaera ethanolica]